MLSQEEKIDYIYEHFKKREKKEKWSFFFKWGFRIFMLFYAVYFYQVTLPALKENFIESIKPDMSFDTEKLKDLFDY